MEEENKIKGGVIIMGSLFWEDEKNCVAGKEKEGKARREWREENLDVLETKPARVPIRYGRFSGEKNRKNTYTMVLSRYYLEKLGTALIVPFSKLFSLNEKVEEEKIYDQMKELSKVEGIYKSPEHLLAKYWAAIAIWINPNSDHYDEIKKYWQNSIINDPNNGYFHKCKDPNNGNVDKVYEWSDGTLLDKNFQLQLPIESDIDFLLCTYTKPKFNSGDSDVNPPVNREYPTSEMIGKAIADSEYYTYFCLNKANGIVTADDEEILKHIQ